MAQVIIYLIKQYQKIAIILWAQSPLLSYSGCRFNPSCSEYGIQAIEKYGTINGLTKTAIRISKCNPFFQGGLDSA